MKPKHQRLIFVCVSMVFLCAAGLLTLRAFSENLVFFYSPADLQDKAIAPDRLIRVGGLVEIGSIEHPAKDRIRFRITDKRNHIIVDYPGMVPALFREGQGVIAEGFLQGNKEFLAKRILTKHDENYLPREVVDALKKSGRWQEGAAK
jgi:cytochrome c-type biogenesis protein CcmE